MKKPQIGTIIGSSGRDCVLIILFQLYGSKARFFEGKLFWVGQYDPPPQLSYWKTIHLLSSLSKIIPIQKTADIIL